MDKVYFNIKVNHAYSLKFQYRFFFSWLLIVTCGDTRPQRKGMLLWYNIIPYFRPCPEGLQYSLLR